MGENAKHLSAAYSAGKGYRRDDVLGHILSAAYPAEKLEDEAQS